MHTEEIALEQGVLHCILFSLSHVPLGYTTRDSNNKQLKKPAQSDVGMLNH